MNEDCEPRDRQNVVPYQELTTDELIEKFGHACNASSPQLPAEDQSLESFLASVKDAPNTNANRKNGITG
jgi:hypothetical protein